MLHAPVLHRIKSLPYSGAVHAYLLFNMRTIYADAPSNADLLNRQGFASGIAEGLVKSFPNGSESIVFGLNGSWGSGKSTLLGFILGQVEVQCRNARLPYVISTFNPWLFSGQEQLQRLFLTQLSRDLGEKSKREKQGKVFTKIAQLLTPVRELAAYAKEINRFNAEPLTKSLLDVMTKLLEQTGKSYSTERSLWEVKSQVNQLIMDNNVRLYIVIDDLDRITPSEVGHMFQLIKLNANFKNTIYVVAYDVEVITQALVNQYGECGRQYLEKIVQVDYKVPAIATERVTQILFESLQTLLEEFAIQYAPGPFYEVFSAHGLKGYFQTLRDVYRYLNAVRFRLPSIHAEVNITQFLTLEAVRVFDSPAFESIYLEFNTFKKYLSFNNFFMGEVPGKHDFFSSHAIHNSSSRSLIAYLFTKPSDLTFLDHPERYYTLAVPAKEVPEGKLTEFLGAEASAARDILITLQEKGSAENLLLRLANPNIKDKTTLNIAPILEALLDFWDTRVEYFDQIEESLWKALKNLSLHHQNTVSGVKQLLTALTSQGNQFSHTRLFYSTMLLMGKYSYDFTQLGVQSIYDSFQRNLEMYVEKLHRDWENTYLGVPPSIQSRQLFVRFALYHALKLPGQYQERLLHLMSHPKSLLAFIRLFVHNNGPANLKVSFRSNVDDSYELIPRECERHLQEQLLHASLQPLDSQDQLNVNAFLSVLASETRENIIVASIGAL